MAARALDNRLGGWWCTHRTSNADFTNRPTLVQHLQEPVEVITIGTNAWFFDFGRAAFGNLIIDWPQPPAGQLIASLGEKLIAPTTLDPSPPGSVRYQRHAVKLDAGQRWHQPRLTWRPPGWLKDESPDLQRLVRPGQPDALELEGGGYRFHFPVDPTP